MKFQILNKAKKKEILQALAVYGISRLDYLLLQTDSKLRIFSGMLSKNELIALLRGIEVDNVGLYFASKEEGIRISLDAVHLLSKQIKHNILEISDEQAKKWFYGSTLEVSETEKAGTKEGFIILKNGEDFIGIGKLTKNKILNFLPKERRIKN
jgi:NOL1/NOP2/fmu family ribosome biogenesis protein